ncbi:bifunctional diguanylate cyclase/phosphodiesterase [Lysinibacillus sp. SGAir0095]|uniref:bifunctional diguanylate cyclase/phosphodiesterase n=1 Tax=Lysinibacillus sp. SGAir0095 TaxID=2070463 RepID=UPI0010CD4522|nr:bifunctional diguanylate cyclase/phosphodiesterase [Lysinibacillus sp. SGAir0095]QCR33859.1 GGDEF domain-containing protein [Lysinibacillus sp. SGAir0095]
MALNQENFITSLETSIGISDFLNTIDSMGVGLSIVDARKEGLPLVYVNKGFEEITGYLQEEVYMKNCRFLQGEETDREQVGKIRNAIRELKTETSTLKNYRKDGSPFWNQFIISPILDNDNKPLYFIGLQFDVTKQIEDEKRAKQRIRQLANFDQLTGLMKLENFKEVLQKYIDRGSEQLAIYRVNLDRFRNINNSYGEHVSNIVLIEAANRLSEIFPKAPITRSFADDYIILHELNDSIELTNTLLSIERILAKPYMLLGEKITIDYSIGISKYPEDGKDVEHLLSNASLALREAKNDSLIRYSYFNNELAKKLETRMTIEKRMVNALDNSEFVVFYQPKVCVKTSEVIGMEALIRWKDPEQGLISPGEFIPIAEETGFIHQLGEWVLLEACRRNKDWQDKGRRHVPVSVNVSALQFMHAQFIPTVKKILQETGLPACFLELEITESILIQPDRIIEKLNELKKMGVLIAIDDFGTGYSSINYLKDLPIDTLKIDRAFVVETPNSNRDNSLLLSIIQLGKSLQLNVLVEGAETEEQIMFLKGSNCDSIQGFYFSKPLSENDMEIKLLT